MSKHRGGEMARRHFMKYTAGAAIGAAAALTASASGDDQNEGVAGMSGKRLGSIFNNDSNNILVAGSGADTTAEEYSQILGVLLDAGPGVFAQDVGCPDPVIYRSDVATVLDKYAEGRDADAMAKLLSLGTDPLAITIAACRERRIPVVASYRMNAEDAHPHQLDLYDFGRAHKDWAIEGRCCLDPAIPEVYAHRMEIFREVAERYDIDGIEFNFGRWFYMISEPHKNHHILTGMVRETRQMLDDVASAQGRARPLLGVRVGAMLAGELRQEDFPGAMYGPPTNQSCEDLGLDVRTWIGEGLVDYVCPSLFWPSWPGLPNTSEFVDLAKGTPTGIYPTLWPWPQWLREGPDKGGPVELDDDRLFVRYRHELCQLALQIYDEGADGISAFNWYFHLHLAKVPNLWCAYYGYGDGGSTIQSEMLAAMGDRDKLVEYIGRFADGRP